MTIVYWALERPLLIHGFRMFLRRLRWNWRPAIRHRRILIFAGCFTGFGLKRLALFSCTVAPIINRLRRYSRWLFQASVITSECRQLRLLAERIDFFILSSIIASRQRPLVIHRYSNSTKWRWLYSYMKSRSWSPSSSWSRRHQSMIAS